MRFNQWAGRVSALAGVLALAAGTVLAQTTPEKKPAPAGTAQPPAKPAAEKPADKAATPSAATKPAGQPSPEQMMAEMMKFGATTEFHEHLKPLAGKWSYITKARMMPDQPWEESKGTAEFESVLGGRFMVQKCKNEKDQKMPFPFEGLGITGYDNMQKKYINVWMDNMGTGIMTSTGTSDSSGKTFTYSGEYDCPITGTKQKARSVLKIAGSDKLVFEMYGAGPDGKEYQNLEVNYTKK